VVLTAAHCLEYKTQQRAGNYGSFVIQKSASESHEFTISRYRAFATSGPGDNDLGLVQLSANVPSSIARPGSLARNMPPNGTKVTDYGYGCTDPNNTKKGTGVKRKRTHTQGAGIRELCPGDSGGPMFWGNAVFAVNSGFKSALFENDDIYATVPNHYAALQGQANAWR
jgi:secreted trypsin-like serine protease